MRVFTSLLFLLFWIKAAWAQAPNISYQTPKIYTVNNPVAPLSPTNTGGNVPAQIYGQVSAYPSKYLYLGTVTGVTVDKAGDVYAEDWDNNRIYKIPQNGAPYVFAGSGIPGLLDGQGTAASFYQPDGIVIDAAGNLYVTDQYTHTIRKITPSGYVSTLAGNGTSGNADGTGAAARFYTPRGMALDVAGNLLVADQANNLIRKVTPEGVVTTFAGTGVAGFNNGNRQTATFNVPTAVEVDLAGNVYVSDAGNKAIRKITPAGVVSTLAGNILFPRELRIDSQGTLYVNSQDGNLVKAVSPTGVVTNFAGTGQQGATNGQKAVATFNSPIGLALDPNGYLYVGDSQNRYVRQISIAGYTIDKTLPQGLSFDAKTGIISGTPSVLSPATNYTVTAYNGSGSSTTVVNIAVVLHPIVFDALAIKLVCDADFDAGATGGQGTISYSSSNLSVAAIVGGKVHLISAGITTITASDGLISVAQNLTVIAPKNPTINIAANLDTVCAGLPVSFTATVNNGGDKPSYQWYLNNTKTGADNAVLSITNIAQTDLVYCVVTRSDSCFTSQKSNQVKGIVTDPFLIPTVSISSSANTICDGATVSFTSIASNQGSKPVYQWLVNNKATGGNDAVFSSNNFVDADVVTCVLTNNTGKCIAPRSVSSNAITINVIKPIPASVSISASATTAYGGIDVVFTAAPQTTGRVNSYNWLINGVSVGLNNAVFTTKKLMNGDQVSCTITVDNLCTAPVNSQVIAMTILSPTQIKIPNTITPNGDGINDVWNIPELVYFPDCTVSIYNRYGAMLYRTIGYGKPWDGYLNSKPLPVATYYYIIDLGNKTPLLKGSIAVIR